MFGEQLLQVRFDTVLDEPGIDSEFVTGVVLDLLDGDPQFLTGLVGHDPQASASSTESSTSQQGGLIQFRGL